jgi:predicted TIM-barrel fold metal-dependent hydrolase
MDGRPVRGRHPNFFFDDEWLALRTEEALEPDLPVVDPHHHVWERSVPYWVPQLLKDLRCGHNIRGTVYVEAGAMYRADGDPHRASLGEVEYANGVAAAFASGYYGALRACAGIVGKVDLRHHGAAAEELLQACIARAPDRFRGVRNMAALDSSPDVSQVAVPPIQDLMMDRRFREGFARLAPLRLSFDSYCYHPQLPQLVHLVDAFPETRIIINHCGARVGQEPYARRKDEVFAEWKSSIRTLADRPNVFMKIGGLIGRLTGLTFIDQELPPTSKELAEAWRPTIETCIEAFGPERCMFESNFPPDKSGVSAVVLWNAFKRVVKDYSDTEKALLFSGSAIHAYRLPGSLGKTE